MAPTRRFMKNTNIPPDTPSGGPDDSKSRDGTSRDDMKLLVARIETYADLLAAHTEASATATAAHKQDLATVRSELAALKAENARLSQQQATLRQQTNATLAEFREGVASRVRDMVRGRALATILCVLLLLSIMAGMLISLRRQSQEVGKLEQGLSDVQRGLEQAVRQQSAIIQFLNADTQRRRQ